MFVVSNRIDQNNQSKYREKLEKDRKQIAVVNDIDGLDRNDHLMVELDEVLEVERIVDDMAFVVDADERHGRVPVKCLTVGPRPEQAPEEKEKAVEIQNNYERLLESQNKNYGVAKRDVAKDDHTNFKCNQGDVLELVREYEEYFEVENVRSEVGYMKKEDIIVKRFVKPDTISVSRASVAASQVSRASSKASPSPTPSAASSVASLVNMDEADEPEHRLSATIEENSRLTSDRRKAFFARLTQDGKQVVIAVENFKDGDFTVSIGEYFKLVTVFPDKYEVENIDGEVGTCPASIFQKLQTNAKSPYEILSSLIYLFLILISFSFAFTVS